MGITKSDKTLSASEIDCGGIFTVTLSLTAKPNIESNPADIVLILDRSGSMAGSALENLKSGAKKFLELMDEATDGTQDGQIGGGSRIAVVSFAETAFADTQLITSVSQLEDAVDALSAGGSTNHADAFSTASALFDPLSANEKVMVLFTDGKTTAGPDASPYAAAEKAKGTEIYCIGLSGNGGIDEAELRDWASDPDSEYVAITPDDGDLEKLFEELAKNIAKPGATEIKINETVDACFRILSTKAPEVGTVSITGETSLLWEIDQLGVKGTEKAELTFTVQHAGSCTGTLPVNESITYSDHEGNTVSFPSPVLKVSCGEFIVIPEDCPSAIDVTVDSCEDAVEFDAGELGLESLGRIAQLDIRLRSVCPNKRVALAVVLNELDANGLEYQRGMKTMTVPAHTNKTCRDVLVKCVRFVLPETLDVSGTADSICDQRKFRARFIAHYIDNDYACCDFVL